MIAMFVAGIVLLTLFAIWDLRFASRPVIAPRFIRNRSVVIAGLIGFLDFVSYTSSVVFCYCKADLEFYQPSYPTSSHMYTYSPLCSS